VALQKAGKDYEGEYVPPYVSAGAVRRVDLGKAAALADNAARPALESRGAVRHDRAGPRFFAR